MKPDPCYEKAEADEPMFVLLARDRHAPTLVWLWAALRKLDGEDVTEAQGRIVDMITWATKHGRKSAGLGQAALVAVLELIATVNMKISGIPDDFKNRMTDAEFARLILSQTHFPS